MKCNGAQESENIEDVASLWLHRHQSCSFANQLALLYFRAGSYTRQSTGPQPYNKGFLDLHLVTSLTLLQTC